MAKTALSIPTKMLVGMILHLIRSNRGVFA